MSETSSFQDLLQAAPLVQDDPASLTGVLSRTPDPTKFALTVASGKTIVLPTSAVKNHTTVSEFAGQKIVSVELDPKELSPDLLGEIGAQPDRAPKNPPGEYIKPGFSDPIFHDWGSHPGFLDIDPHRSLPWFELNQPIPPGWW